MRVQLAVITLLLASAGAALARSEEREVPAFDSVQISAGIRATVELGQRRPVVLEGDEAVLAEIEATVEGGTLFVGFRRNHRWHGGWHDDRGTVKVTIQTPDLRSVGASGGAIVRAALSRADETALDASGGSEIHARGLDARALSINASGGAVVEVSGRADEAALHLSGGSHAVGRDLEVKDLRINGSGGAELHLRGKASARVSTSGGAAIDYLD